MTKSFKHESGFRQVPVSTALDRSVGEDHKPVIATVLRALTDRLFPQRGGIAKTSTSKNGRSLCLETLKDAIVNGNSLPVSPMLEYRKEIEKIDRESIHPVMKTSFQIEPIPGCDLHEEVGEATDGTLITLRILHGYLRYVYESEDSDDLNYILPRPIHPDVKKSRTVQWPSVSELPAPPANFLIDPLANLPFCCSPAARRQRLGVDICVIKMLWDVGSRQRKRRLKKLLDPNNSVP